MKNKLFNYLTLIVIYAAVFYVTFNHFTTKSSNNFITYLGLTLMIISLVLFTLARIKLSNSFQLSAEANDLIKDGIYKIIRHPIYLFGFTLILGLFIFMQVYYGIIFLFIIGTLQIKRIKKEERVLFEKFGDEYLEYKKRTWF